MSTTRPAFNTKSPTIKRILQESKELSRHPDPSLTAHPLESNLFEWHFTITGPPASPYENGIYHGRIILPPAYPLRPPMFRFTTPSGRFEVNREICLSISGHHEETWQPAWGIRTALCAIRAFMESNAAGQLGGLDVGDEPRRRYARESRAWRCGECGTTNEEVIAECRRKWEEAKEKGEVQEDSTASAIPDELRLAYKEDLGEKRESDASPAATGSVAGTVPEAATQSPAQVSPSANSRMPPEGAVGSSTHSDLVPARPARGDSTSSHLIPTRTVAPTQLVSRDDGVPAWVDKAIFGVALSLILMILRRLFG